MIYNTLQNINKSKDLQVATLLVIFFLSEALTKITYFFHANFHNYSALIKGFFIVYVLIYTKRNLTKQRYNILIFLISMSLIFYLGQSIFNSTFWSDIFFKNLIFFSRYMFVFIIVLYFIDFPFNFVTNIHLKIYEKIVLFNGILIIIGYIFDLKIFYTYYNRFGFNGLFMVPSIATFFYALALSYFSYNYVKYQNKKIQLLIVSVVCLLVGTKALLLFLLLTYLHIFWIKKIYKKKTFYVFFTMFSAIILFYIDTIIKFIKQKFYVLHRVYLDYDLITMLTSYRNLKIKEVFISVITTKWSFLNYLFGGTDFNKNRVEFEIFDIFLFFGIIGSIYYLIFYFKKIFQFKELNTFGKIQIIFLLAIASLSGTFFNNAPIALYLLVVLSGFHKNKII